MELPFVYCSLLKCIHQVLERRSNIWIPFVLASLFVWAEDSEFRSKFWSSIEVLIMSLFCFFFSFHYISLVLEIHWHILLFLFFLIGSSNLKWKVFLIFMLSKVSVQIFKLSFKLNNCLLFNFFWNQKVKGVLKTLGCHLNSKFHVVVYLVSWSCVENLFSYIISMYSFFLKWNTCIHFLSKIVV